MSWDHVEGRVMRGHGVASGAAGDPRFPNGTIAMQKPFFRQRGLELDPYYSATINVSIAPCACVIKEAKYTFRGVKWAPEMPAEDFSFFDCRVIHGGARQPGLIYYPHPDTKPEHAQPPDVLEVLTGYIDGLSYGDGLTLKLRREQIDVRRPA